MESKVNNESLMTNWINYFYAKRNMYFQYRFTLYQFLIKKNKKIIPCIFELLTFDHKFDRWIYKLAHVGLASFTLFLCYSHYVREVERANETQMHDEKEKQRQREREGVKRGEMMLTLALKQNEEIQVRANKGCLLRPCTLHCTCMSQIISNN